jgi:hypothetical protein
MAVGKVGVVANEVESVILLWPTIDILNVLVVGICLAIR